MDRKILHLPQQDATLTIQELSRRIDLSPTPCRCRVQGMDAAGIILRRVTLLDPESIDVGVTAFVPVKTCHHSMEWHRRFARAVSAMAEIAEFHRMSGDIDHLLKIVVPHIAGYGAVYKRLITAIDLADVRSSFALERIKSTTASPLGYVAIEREQR